MNRARRKRPCRLRAEGPLAPYFEPYSEYLADRGYSQISFCKKTFLINEFSLWLEREDIPVSKIASDHEAAFLHDRAGYRVLKGGDRIALSGVTDWLRRQGVIEGPVAMSDEISEIDRALLEYKNWLREDRGLASATIENYVGYVSRFLTEVSGGAELRLASLSPRQITDYIRRLAPKDRTFAAAKHIVTALRSFFRFARYRDYILIDLAATVPSVAGWSMASIPRAMPADQVQTLLTASKTWRTPSGLRNRAVLLLLARLGLRAKEIIRLELEDIDWNEGFLRVHGKGGVERPLPLPHDVGEAIAAYLEHGRPKTACRRVFVRSRAPFDGLRSHSDICQIVARAIGRTGIISVSTGAHQLRHALAIDMLRRYAKVDLDALREVALPWPGALP